VNFVVNEVSANVKSRQVELRQLELWQLELQQLGVLVGGGADSVRASLNAGGTPALPGVANADVRSLRAANRNRGGLLAFVAPLSMFFAMSLLTANQASFAADSAEAKGKGHKHKGASCCNHMKTADASSAMAAPTRKAVLEPSSFPGMASFGYASAKACPEVVEKLFCYCGCDMTDKHTSLLDCFTSMHGLDCHICQEEAVLALKLHRDGMSVADIQKTIDEKYTHDYPFQEDTEAYKKYKSSRLYAKDGSNTEVAGPAPSDDAAATAAPKLKPGKKVGKCCAAGNHKDKKN